MRMDEVIQRVLPQFFPAQWLNARGIVFSDFPSRIRIGYVLRDQGCYSYIVEEEFSALPITLEELHAVALTNLAQLPSASISIAKVACGVEGWISATEDNFAAARILLPEVLKEFSQVMGDQFLVSLSHRDDCFCWSLGQPTERQDRHTRDALARFVHEEYNLTPDILLFSQDRFQLHRQQVIDEPDAAVDSGRHKRG